MAGFIFDLARLLAGSTARSLREDAGRSLSRAEALAVATVLEILSLEGEAPAPAAERPDTWADLERQARAECEIAQRARARTRPLSPS